MSKPKRSRVSAGTAFDSSPARSPFKGFATASSPLSYLSEPPDFSTISDPNVVVSLKNLLKKDGTTKAKALEDLIIFVQAHPFDQDGGVEEPLLDAWVQLYPRMSVDNSRRVRELSHHLQLEILKSARKRMEKRIPKIIGAWLAGTFDKDRVVSRAATEGLSSFLTTEDKIAKLWTKCQTQILDYAIEAIRETPDTLSDERTTTKEDAEAKYYRVMAGALLLVLNLLPKMDIEQNREKLDVFLVADPVWALAAADDTNVRRAIYQLCQICLEKYPNLLSSQLPKVGRALVSDALRCKQTGSTTDLIRALTSITKTHPEVWGSKKHPLSRLQSLVEKGSQGGFSSFWEGLSQLIVLLVPESISYSSASDLMKALRVGISSREEPRGNAAASWTCYMNSFQRLLHAITPESLQVEFIQANFYPLPDQFLHPATEKSTWTSGGQLSILAKGWSDLAGLSQTVIQQSIRGEWQRLKGAFVSRISNALPEISKDFEKSQQTIAGEGTRWFALINAIISPLRHAEDGDEASSELQKIVLSNSQEIVDMSLSLLKRRNYKPFGAASILQSAIKMCPYLFDQSGNTILESLFPSTQPEELNTMLSSPSAPTLLSSFNLLGAIPEQAGQCDNTWKTITETLLQSKTPHSVSAITTLVSSERAAVLAQRNTAIQDFLLHKCLDVTTGEADNWSLFNATLTFGVLSNPYLHKLAVALVQALGKQQQHTNTALQGLEVILQKRPSVLSDESDLHVDLVAKLLSLTEISVGDISTRVASLRELLDKHATGQPPLMGIIHDNLDNAGVGSLEIPTLVQQATSLQQSGAVVLEQLFPSTNIWMNELQLFLPNAPSPSLSLTSDLGGAYGLVHSSSVSHTSQPRRDRLGRSIPARMALYTEKLLELRLDLSTLPEKFRVELLYLLHLVAEVAADQLTLPNNAGLWNTTSSDSIAAEVEDFVSSVRSTFNTIVAEAGVWKSTMTEGDRLVDDLITLMLEQTKDLSPLALYSAKALSTLLQSMTEAHGFPSTAEQRFIRLEVMKAKSATIFSAIALITGFGEALASSKTVNRLCNGLVSDIAGAFPTAPSTLLSMVLLNSCLSVYEVGELPVENRRQVFAVKQITSWTDTPDEMDSRLAAEAFKALQRLFPNVKQVYGPYWEQAIEYCILLWHKASKDLPEARIPYLHASLKLSSTLESMIGSNDDLDDALVAHAERTSLALIELLKLPRDSNSQPSDIVDALLCRRVANIPLEHVKDLSDLYGLIASESREIQTAAFDLLHKALPAAQEQLSVDVILEKRDAQLPDELLSLLLDAPTLERFPDDLLVQFPTPIRSYLLTWLLIFDAYRAAGLKVRNDYTEQLKALNSVSPLMEFTFDVLGHSAAHALNLDKEGFSTEQILTYDMKTTGNSESEERSLQCLLIHLYYLVLRYVPGLFKTWFLDCRSKQTKIAVEAWMTKYFSPIIISQTLDDVAEWAAKQEPAGDDEKELLVRVSKAAREITAGYEVDELQAAIAIRVPPAYPLESVSVVGINRVAVNEKKWQSWIMTTQGVITFSNGSIIDGLTAFRRNVVGALKGQTECAICYSVISTDKKMPDKRCSTCRNLFHRTCLYKWFQTSNQNTCPLCRNPIEYLGAETKSRRGGQGGF